MTVSPARRRRSRRSLRRASPLAPYTFVAALVALLLCAAPLAADPPKTKTPPRLTIAVDGDRELEVVMGPARSARSIVYLHGVCGDPLAFES